MNVLITGAAGNLGSQVARHLAQRHELKLLVHKRQPPPDLISLPNVNVHPADLARVDTLHDACSGADCIVHLAGVLFAPKPAEFLPKTNLGYVQNLLAAAGQGGVRKFILVSFPHVEGETTPAHPATDRVDREPEVVHFRTRLAAERAVLAAANTTSMTPIILRAGVVYGPGIKLIEAARRLLRYRLLAVWARPTWIHLISLPDFLAAITAAVESPVARGIYNVCDDAPLTLQEFLDRLAAHFRYPKPHRLPESLFHAAAGLIETTAYILGTAAPLTRDIIRAGMTSSVADNRRMKQELLPALSYPSFEQGVALL